MKFCIAYMILFAVITVTMAQTTITLQPDGAAGKDAELWSLQPSTNFGDYPELKANSWTWGGDPGLQRAVFQFDLSQVPAGATIQDAQLFLYGNHNGLTEFNTGANGGLLQRVTQSWDESAVTWNNQPTTTDVNQVSIPASTSDFQDYQLNVTALMQDMMVDPANSYGFLIRLADESGMNRLVFSSSDNSTASYHPKLVITYEFNADTCFTTFIDQTSGADAELWSINAGTNYGDYPELKANSWTWAGDHGVQRALFKFDLSGIPAGALVTSANLSLYGNAGSATEFHDPQSGSNEAYLQRVTQPWEESTVTWDNQPATSTQNQVLLSQSTSQYEDYLNYDVTALINDILDSAANYGFMLRLATETDFRRLVFKSGDNGTAALNPKLEICYSENVSANATATPSLGLRCLPNPFAGIANLTFSVTNTTNVEMAVYDLVGRKVFTRFLNNASGIQIVTLDRSLLGTSNIYQVVVKSNDAVETIKIIGLNQ